MLEEASLPERKGKERKEIKAKAKERVLAAAAAERYAAGANDSKIRVMATTTTSGVEVQAAMDIGNSDANAVHTTLRRRKMGKPLATIMLLMFLITLPRLI